ncbi:858acc9d-4fb9-4623-9d45-c7be3ecac94a [Sclerotinia trifoliorum]|uniref:858acc9d-4fb9-4623-9d45-c7be3ecac94a n=1 Tax=Sclerotinia trifoliorum TaxID=28548 RepID=A0A8H2VV04_9HELO|nr:858acc9d-4fb9-4623-9d45-c7be3ecac94a [Sclerotinia trifoliorum]
MSLNGSRSVLNRWKNKRTQSTISAPPGTAGVGRPTTSGGLNSWTEYTPSSEEPFQKAVEEAVLNALNSDAFRNVIASQIDPVTAALSRQQEKLNALKATTLNLESSLSSSNIKDTLDPALKPISQLIDDVPDTEDEIESLVEGQKKILEILKSLEERLSGIDTKFEEFEEKITSLDGEIVNADLRSAIRFGELSNELQDRNKMLGERLWSVEGDLGKKIDGSHRKLIGMVEDLGKSSRNVINKVSSMEFDSSSSNSSKLDEMLNENSQMVDRMESLKKSVTKLEESQKNIQTTEKGLARNIQEVRDIVSSLNTSSLEHHSKRLDDIERSIITVRKELEGQGHLASIDSKLLSTNTSRLSNIIEQVTKINEVVESVNEHISANDQSIHVANSERLDNLTSTTTTVKETIDRVEQHVRTLNTSQFDAHRDKLTMIASMMTSFAESMAGIQDGVSKTTSALLPSNEVAKFDDLVNRLSDMRAELDARLEAQSNSLEDIHKQTVLPIDTKKLDDIATMLNNLQPDSLSTLLASHTDKLDTISNDLSTFHSGTESTLKTITVSLETIDQHVENGTAAGRESAQGLHSQLERFGASLDNQDVVLRDIKQSGVNNEVLGAIEHVKSSMEQDKRSDEILGQLMIMKELVDSVKADNRKSEMIQDLAALKNVVDSIKDGSKDDEIMEAIKNLDTSLASSGSDYKSGETLQSLSQSIGAVHTDVLEIKDASIGKTLGEILAIRQHLKDNATSLATAHEGILSVDTKIKSSEESITTAIQNLQSAIGTDMHDNKSALITSISDVATELETEMKNLNSRLMTTTSELRSDIKNIDFGPTNTSIDALSRDVQSTYKTSVETAGNLAALPEAFTNIRSHVSSENVSMNMSIDSISKFVASIDEAIKETGRDVQGNTEMLANVKSSVATSTNDIRFLLDKQVPLIRQDIQAIDLSQLESAAAKNQASVDSIEKSVPQIIKLANDHASALSQLDYKMKYLISGDIAKIGKAIEAVDQALSKAAMETISAVEGNAARLSNIPISSRVSKPSKESPILMPWKNCRTMTTPLDPSVTPLNISLQK